MQPGDRMVCAFVEPQAKGLEFKQWPLHVTVVPWFRIELGSAALAGELQQILGSVTAFKVVMDRQARLGNNKIVNLVKLPSPFVIIEQKVRQTLKNHAAWLVDESTKHRRSYLPHVTAQPSRRLHKGDGFMCSQLYLIEQKGECKQITAEVKLAYDQDAA